ncbi:hypothetical protein [Streptomyces lavendofoliae]|nr:hypothetical protein [Streptomyces lavendofoliae]
MKLLADGFEAEITHVGQELRPVDRSSMIDLFTTSLRYLPRELHEPHELSADRAGPDAR